MTLGVRVRVQGNWLSYRDAVEYSSRFLRNDIVILANADIHFNHTLARIKNLDMRGLHTHARTHARTRAHTHARVPGV